MSKYEEKIDSFLYELEQVQKPDIAHDELGKEIKDTQSAGQSWR